MKPFLLNFDRNFRTGISKIQLEIQTSQGLRYPILVVGVGFKLVPPSLIAWGGGSHKR